MSVGEHFERVATVYESLRTTDEAPVRKICQLLPDRPVAGLDIGCGTGRYTQLLRALLPGGSLLVAGDVSAAMLAQLKAANRGHAGGVVPLLAAAEQLPLRDASLDVVTAFNCVHHFDLGRFLTSVARVLAPGGQLFIYTRTPKQNARTIWGRYFPGFTEHEQRLHSQAAIRNAVRRTGGLKMVATQTFQHPRTSTAERLRAQAEGRHYSTFSLYTPQELRAGSSASYRIPASSERRIPVARNTAIRAASRRCANARPAQARSSRGRSPAAKTGTGLSGTPGGFSPAIGSGTSSSAASHLKNCWRARYWLLAYALLYRSSSRTIHRWMSCLPTCSQLVRPVSRRRWAAANHCTASV